MLVKSFEINNNNNNNNTSNNNNNNNKLCSAFYVMLETENLTICHVTTCQKNVWSEMDRKLLLLLPLQLLLLLLLLLL
jgi:hypothetical protein